MDVLPTEILGIVFNWLAVACTDDKNSLLSTRLVCKAFSNGIRPYAMKCVQLDFSRLGRGSSVLDNGAISACGHLIDAAHVDMMVVRDEEEIARLTSIFSSLVHKVPELGPIMDSLHKYCMGDSSFTELDYQRELSTVMDNTPNLTSFKLNLPHQILGSKMRTATFILAQAMSSIRARPEEHKSLERLVIDNMTDTTLLSICNNPIDLGNCITTFRNLRHLIISFNRQESDQGRQWAFARNFWLLIERATSLKSLCLVGWNVKKNNDRIMLSCFGEAYWEMRSLPCDREFFGRQLTHLKCLELKRLGITAPALMHLLTELADTLKELYLIEVNLKVRGLGTGQADQYLWIGLPGRLKAADDVWIAEELRGHSQLRLDVLRAHAIGYDELQPPDIVRIRTPYDLIDFTARGRCFDQQFVDAVMNGPDPMSEDLMLRAQALTDPGPLLGASGNMPCICLADSQPILPFRGSEEEMAEHTQHVRKMRAYDTVVCQRYSNTTSWFHKYIDDQFRNWNRTAVRELQNIIDVSSRGMQLLEVEINDAIAIE